MVGGSFIGEKQKHSEMASYSLLRSDNTVSHSNSEVFTSTAFLPSSPAEISAPPPPPPPRSSLATLHLPPSHVIDVGSGSWHQSSKPAVFPAHEEVDLGSESAESLAVLDFDLLCASVALNSRPLPLDVPHMEGGTSAGVQRMWEGGILDCLDDTHIALQTACCPCITFGKNMERAGFGTCLGKGATYFSVVASAIISFGLVFLIKDYSFLYLSMALLLLVAIYTGYYRNQIRRRFNIQDNADGGVVTAMDDHVNPIFCGYCTLCQEARTLEMNNVRDGNWRGRGDTFVVGFFPQSLDTMVKEPAIISMSAIESCSKEAADHHHHHHHAWSKSSAPSDPFIAHC